MTRRRRLTPLAAALATGVAGSALGFLAVSDLLGQRIVFVLLTLLLLVFLASEAARVRLSRPGEWLLDPAVVASALTFGLAFVVGNVLFFMPADALALVGLVPEVTPAMVKLMWLVLLGAIGMWLGYHFPVASGLASPGVQRAVGRWFSRSHRPRKLALIALVTISVISRLLQIRFGVFGYSSNYDQLVAMGGVTQYLSMGASLGSLALIVASLDYFSLRESVRAAKAKLVIILLIEVAFGVLSGFKSQIVMPFIVVGACKYLCTKSIPKAWIGWFFAALVLAYAVVQPFRVARNTDSSFQGTSVSEIVDLLLVSRDDAVSPQNSNPVWISFIARSSLSYIGSLGVEYKDSVESLPEGSPRFLVNIAFAPAYAFIPRLIWKSKPTGDLGLWYTQVVMGLDSYSSTAMSPVTYLYFAGGAIAVFIGFMCLGIFQKLIVLLIRPGSGSARAFVYLALLPSVSNIGSAVDGTIVSLLRIVPLLFLLQYFVYQRGSAKPPNWSGRANQAMP